MKGGVYRMLTLHRKTIEDNRNKDLSCMEKKAYVCC